MSTQQTTGRASAGAREGSVARKVPAWCVPLVAATAGLLVWGAGSVLGIEAVVHGAGGDTTVGAASVVVVSLVAGFAGWGVRALLRRFAGTARQGRSPGERAWMVSCAVVLLVSLLGPLGAVSASATILLLALHVTVGGVVALGLRR